MVVSSHLTRLPVLADRCKSMADLKQIQAQLTTLGLAGDSFLVSKLLLFSAISDSGDLNYSQCIFLALTSPSTFVCNTLIRGFSRSRNPNRAISLYIQMLRSHTKPDHLTFPFLAKSCARLASLFLGRGVHCHITRHGHELDLFIVNSLIHMYASCGQMPDARRAFDIIPLPNLVSWNALLDGFAKCEDLVGARGVFDEMPERDVVSWSAMIDGYVKGGDYRAALALFERMQIHGPKPNEITMVSLLCACAHLGVLEKGRSLHQYIKDNNLVQSLAVTTSLVDMYAKCGSIAEAMNVFRSFPAAKTDVLIWNSIIGGLAMQGMARDSVEMFREMLRAGMNPDEITYLGLLSACAHGGFVGEAWEFFGSIREQGLRPHVEHYACMVDVLGRAGRMEEAYELVRTMPMEPSGSLLGALLSACQTHGWMELGEVVGKKLVALEPEHDGRYVGLSNVLAGSERWEDAKKMREEMEKRGVRKAPGRSEIEVGGALQRFIAHDMSHPDSNEVYWMLSFVTKEMKMELESFTSELLLE
ncbi:pentatricopeptide repeat-containing protein At5g08305 [Phalaenopsis equestris]|uniref:pentatricopeptide repeat-containing protein At5g08305 n=1 Tax=Phalaenopsis equestris TaxID=78828 RepID=UPI0009E58C77|nr:pentatricopeptide repeat-containing protein At5g08305 [Phalaenopsis equestris]XP_020591782.1 pentatricopeptide repeat-containing protein At5g08305 [Phalaenopsis equestris]